MDTDPLLERLMVQLGKTTKVLLFLFSLLLLRRKNVLNPICSTKKGSKERAIILPAWIRFTNSVHLRIP